MADQGAEGLLSGFLRRRRSSAAAPYLRGRVLDFGCGSGALSEAVDPALYAGVDIDPAVVRLAEQLHRRHQFHAGAPPDGQEFDTVVSLAVIEHMKDPAGLLAALAATLAPGGRIVLTTPHPAFRHVHEAGARIGLFSQAASEEHESFIDARAMRELARRSGLRVVVSRRFLFGANQLFVLEREAAGE